MEIEYAGRHAREGVVIVDEQGKILSANRAAEALLGYGAGQLTNLFVSDMWLGHRSPARTRAQDAELTRRNGETLPVTLDVTPLNGAAEGGRLLSFMKRDELERLNESLLHAQRLAGIGTLTASVAHELTNPISIITTTCANLADELRDETIDRAELLQAVELIEQSAFRCARIVEVLRHYAHNVGPAPDGAAEDGMTIAITSPAAIMQDALTMVEQQFRKQARVTVETELQPDPATIFCDHHRIAQVLINLLINARDAMQPAGGVVGVKFWTPDLRRETALAAHVRAVMPRNGNGAAADDLFAFSVADTGTGIAPTIMERIFEPFFTTKPRGQGTGLGLFIAQGIVAEHHGCIFAENNPGGGATFTVVLPRRQ
ncbi:putative Histidine kinase [Candidatus Promineifilum breve]|uniref:histidine kinase n=1 Tax=Candidatus Promineifilum breve TaxID=1806508 RepID=A0A160T4X5_9CHLR|nr:ATP-binding protein [Candidatus Promineifilum breve]CUS04158.2 putative Histidine kinase [Candidatus Promineifilum breve]